MNLKSIIRNKEKEPVLKKFSSLIIVLFGVFLIINATMGEIKYWEIDSYALPSISMQYRGSLIINQSDIDQARNDFPSWYQDVNGYDSLHSSKLVKITEDSWLSYYFPVYSFVCIPAKLVLQILSLPQERAFPITNAILLIAALETIRRKLQQPIKNKLLLILLIIISPVFAYVNFASAEIFILSLVIISLVHFSNKEYKRAALFVSIASMPNPTIMVYGMAIIFDYFYNMFTENKKISPLKLIKLKFIDTIKLAACFIPCLIPFISNFLYLKQGNMTSGGAMLNNYLQRYGSYLFDTNLGYLAYFPILLLLFMVMIVVCIIKKKYRAISYAIAFFGTVGAFSLMYHINCGMEYTSRYVIWSFPIMAFFVTTIGMESIKKVNILRNLIVMSVCCSFLLIYINSRPYYHCLDFNSVTKTILDRFPYLYNPYSALFNSRANHVDGGYTFTTPVYYTDSENGYVRKILLTGSDEDKQRVMDEFLGDTQSIEFLKEKVDEVENDGQYHYINIPRNSRCEISPKNLEQRGQLITKDRIESLSNVEISGENKLGVAVVPITIKPNTYYKICLKLTDDYNMRRTDNLFVDFYGGSNYDNSLQEQKITYKSNEYNIILNSGDIPNVDEQIYARIIATSKDIVGVESFEIYEMEEVTLESNNEIVKRLEGEKLSGDYKLDFISIPVDIKEHMTYKIEVDVTGYQGNDDNILYVDLYGGAGYDNAQQEERLHEGKNTIYIESDDTTTALEQICVRIVATTKNPVVISNLEVTEIYEESNIQ